MLKEPYYPKLHTIYEKDVFRLMKENRNVEKSNLVKKPSGKMSL